MSISETPPPETNARLTPEAGIPISKNSRTGHSWLFWIFVVSGLLVLTAVVFFAVIAPLMQPAVDPNLGQLTISQSSADESENRQPQQRGSITDRLFEQPVVVAEHPLDPVLAVAEEGLHRIRNEIVDYTALMVKQERVHGTLVDEEMMRIKVRHSRAEREPPVPKSFYLKFEQPRAKIGQEVIWVEGRDEGKLVAHAGGLSNLLTVRLDPNSFFAMRGNNYPVTELGIKTLLERMLEKGRRDRDWPECEVDVDRDVEIDGRECTRITITHPQPRDHFEFYQAIIYIDDQLDLPVGYEGFLWPETEGGQPLLQERYFYRDLKTNVGLEDADFDPENPEYKFP